MYCKGSIGLRSYYPLAGSVHCVEGYSVGHKDLEALIGPSKEVVLSTKVLKETGLNYGPTKQLGGLWKVNVAGSCKQHQLF
jgi:hypothetical protein